MRQSPSAVRRKLLAFLISNISLPIFEVRVTPYWTAGSGAWTVRPPRTA